MSIRISSATVRAKEFRSHRLRLFGVNLPLYGYDEPEVDEFLDDDVFETLRTYEDERSAMVAILLADNGELDMRRKLLEIVGVARPADRSRDIDLTTTDLMDPARLDLS